VGQRRAARAGDDNIFYGKGTKIVNWEGDFFLQQRIVSGI
jgi:hypothetical protein